MGFKIACAAFPVTDSENILERMKLINTGQADEFNEATYSGGIVENDYFLIWKNTSDIDFSKSERKVLNELNDCLILAVSETVMSGYVVRMKNAEIFWQVTYSGHEDPVEFLEEGSVPPFISQKYRDLCLLYEKNEGTELEADYRFDILSETFKHFTGHKYDDAHNFKFFELKSLAKKPWWKIF